MTVEIPEPPSGPFGTVFGDSFSVVNWIDVLLRPRYPRHDGALSDAIPGIGPSGAPRATRFAPGETVSLQPVRRSVGYAFTAFHSVHPATAASLRPCYEKR